MRNSYKFFNRYATKGINNKLPLELQGYLWSLITELMKKEEVDFLQIFEFKRVDEKTLEISHKQEEPRYEMVYQFKIDDYDLKQIDQSKVYVIDDLTHSTMLFSEEY